MFINIRYRLFLFFANILAKLPLKWQYYIADFIYVVIYKVLRYRSKVVRENLKNSFPNKTQEEIKDIEIKFYKHLSDVMIETIVMSGISAEELKRRMSFEDVTQLTESVKESEVIVTIAHYGLWEYALSYSLFTGNKIKAVYRPLSNKALDKFYYYSRSRFCEKPVPMNDVAKEILSDMKNNKHNIFALIADQTPPKASIKHWFDFLNQPTGFFQGVEKLAKKYHLPVYYLHIAKKRRGEYFGTLNLIYDGKEELPDNEITLRYVKELEKRIIEEPYLWMWSHRRWKHKKDN